MQRIYKTDAIILKRKNYQETDRIVTIFSSSLGKMTVFAKGIRQVKSRRAPHVELFNHVSLTLYHGRTHDTLVEATAYNTFLSLKGNLEKIATAYTIVELVDLLCAERQENTHVFFYLLKTLTQLDYATYLEAGLVRKVGYLLLYELGFISDSQMMSTFDSISYVEHIVERRLRSQNFLQSLDRIPRRSYKRVEQTSYQR